MRIFRIIIIAFLTFSAFLTLLHTALVLFFNYNAFGYFVLYDFLLVVPLVISVYFPIEYFSKKKGVAIADQLRKRITLLLIANVLLLVIAVIVFRIIKKQRQNKEVAEISSSISPTAL